MPAQKGAPLPIVITGGAGFVVSSLAIAWRDGHEMHAFDDRKRRGSELDLERFRKAGVKFVHGDLRERATLEPGFA